MSNAIPFVKVVENLDGKERAKLFIKDFHQKRYGDKVGYLSESDKRAVLKMPDSATYEEFKEFLHIYTYFPDVALFLLHTHSDFMLLYQTLAEAHFRLKLCRALQDIRNLVNGMVARLVTEQEHEKLIQDSREKTMPIDELIDTETALALVEQNKISELRVDAYEKFNLEKSPLRYDDIEKDMEFKKMFIEERARQEAKIKEAIASGRLISDGKVIKIIDWEKYPDRLDRIFTSILDDYYLVIRSEDNDPITKAWQGSIKKLLGTAVGFFDAVSPINAKGIELFMAHRVSFKDNLMFKETISELHTLTSELLTMMHIASRIKQELGFDPFLPTDNNITSQDQMDAITASIKEHNEIILEATRDDGKEAEAWLLRGKKEKCYKEVEDINDYLIADPIVDKELYKKWLHKVFGERYEK